MTVETDLARAQYATNATTGPWTVPFPFLADADLGVTWTDAAGNDALLRLDIDYSVSGAGTENGGTITTALAYPAGGQITILRDIDILQESEFVDGDPLPAKTLERGFDQLTMVAQQLRELFNRAISFPSSYAGGTSIGDVVTRGGKLLGFDVITGAITYVSAASGSALELASQLASSLGTSIITYLATGLNAVAQPLARKLDETKTLGDFGWSGSASVATNNAALTAALAWIGAATYTVIPGKVVLATRSLRVPDIDTSGIGQFSLNVIVKDGVRMYANGAGSAAMQFTGTGIAIQLGDALSEHANIEVHGFSVFSTTNDPATQGIVPINCIRGCRITGMNVWGFGKNCHPQGEAFGLFMDNVYFHDALVNNLHWEGSTACAVSNFRFDTAGDHNVIIDGQSSAALTPPANFSPLNVCFKNGAIQGASKSGIYCIDVQSLEVDGVFFEGNNQAASVWANVYCVQGTGAIKADVIRVTGGYMTSGSSAGSTHRGVVVNSAHLVEVRGVDIRGSSFDKGVLTGADVDRLEVVSYINIAGNEVDAQPGTVVHYQDSSGGMQWGQRTTPSSFFNLKWPVNNGNTMLVSNPSTTAGSVALALNVGTTGTNGYGITLTDGLGVMNFRVLSGGAVQNQTGTIGTVSDAKTKFDIQDASPQLADVMKLRLRKFRRLADPTGPLELGYVYQEVKETSPGCVYETDDFEEVEGLDEVDEIDAKGKPTGRKVMRPNGQTFLRPTGTKTGAVKTSIITLKFHGAFQEHVRNTRADVDAILSRLETLETKAKEAR